MASEGFGYVGLTQLGFTYIIQGATNEYEAIKVLADRLTQWGWRVTVDPKEFSLSAERNKGEVLTIKVEIARIIGV